MHRTLAEFEPLARARMSPTAYDYVAGGSWDELTLADNDVAWRRHRLRPRVLVDVGTVSTATTLLGVDASMPVATAPMAVHGLAQPDAERGTALARRRGRRAVHDLDDVVVLDRGGRRRRPRCDALVPALHPGGPRPQPIDSSSARPRRATGPSS